MPKKPTAPKTSNSQGLIFTIRQELDFDTDEPVEFGCFSRNWEQEKH